MKIIKKMAFLALVIMLISFVYSFAFQPAFAGRDFTTIANDVDDKEADDGVKGAVKNLAKVGVGVIKVVSLAVIIVVMLMLAIKYMNGAASERADIKKSLLPFLIGSVIIFGATNVIGIIMNLSNSITAQ